MRAHGALQPFRQVFVHINSLHLIIFLLKGEVRMQRDYSACQLCARTACGMNVLVKGEVRMQCDHFLQLCAEKAIQNLQTLPHAMQAMHKNNKVCAIAMHVLDRGC
jgi:hypothetical protein